MTTQPRNEPRAILEKLNASIWQQQLEDLRTESLLTGRSIAWMTRRAIDMVLLELKEARNA
jgi:hypothetical protein